MQEKVMWLDTIAPQSWDSGTPPPPQVDVAVIGGGYTGLAAARTLAQGGAQVALFERETIGWGASSRNGGMVLTGLKLGVDALIANYGRETAQHLFRASLASIDCVEALVAEAQIDCDFARTGHLEVAYKPAHFQAFRQQADLMAREFGHQVEILPPHELSRELGSSRYHGGLIDPASAAINPARYLVGLATAAQRAGAALYEYTPVTQVNRTHGGFRLETPRGPVQAKELFVATNGYTSRVTPPFHQKVIPIGSYIIATEPLPPALSAELIPHNRMVFDSKNFLYYFRLTSENRLLFGGRASFVPATTATVRQSAEILRRGMISVYPQLQHVQVAYAWGGTLGFTFNILPHAGQLEGAWYAMGYGGHGVAMATYLGIKIAHQMLGGPNENPFRALPFPGAPLGLYDGRPWFLPLAGVWYRLLDWLT